MRCRAAGATSPGGADARQGAIKWSRGEVWGKVPLLRGGSVVEHGHRKRKRTHRKRIGRGEPTSHCGGLYANWPELRDVTRMRYPLIEADARSEPRNEDPMPKIRQCMKDLCAAAGRGEKRSDDPSPSRQSSLARDILLDRRGYAAAGPRRAASLGAGTPPLLARSRPGRPIRRRRVRFQHEWVFGADRPTNESDRIEFRPGIRTTRASVQVE